MRKSIGVFYFAICVLTAVAQNNQSAETRQFATFKNLSMFAETSGLHTGSLDSSICIKMLTIAQQLDNDSLLAISYNLIGEYVSRIRGDNAIGLEYYFKAIPLAEKSNDKRRLSSLYFDISLIYMNLLNYEEAVKYVRKGGANLPDKSHPLYDFMLAQYQRGMVTYFVAIKQPDSALNYVQPFLVTSRKIKSPLFTFSAYFLSGAAFDQDGDAVMALTYFKKAADLADSLDNAFGMLRFELNYVPFLLKSKRINDAKMQSERLLAIGNKNRNNDIMLIGSGFMRQVFDSLRKTDSAYFYSRMEAKLNAQIFSQNNINKIQALAFTEQIRIMEEETKAKAVAEERLQNIQYALIALSIIIFITVFLLLSRTIIANEKIISFFAVLGLLVVFEFINLLIHPWLARITHESPILMLLALVCIAALLIPLHHRLEHRIRVRMIEKNKKIRLAAAKKTIEELEYKTV